MTNVVNSLTNVVKSLTNLNRGLGVSSNPIGNAKALHVKMDTFNYLLLSWQARWKLFRCSPVYRMRRGETGPGLLGPPLAFGVRNIPLIPFHGLIKSEPGSCRGWSSMSSMLAPPHRRWKMSQRMRPDSRIRRSSVQDPSRPDQTPPQLSDELGVELWTSCQPQVSEATHPHPDRRRFCDRHHPRRAS